jgi:hypothetical protein
MCYILLSNAFINHRHFYEKDQNIKHQSQKDSTTYRDHIKVWHGSTLLHSSTDGID